MFKPTCKDDSNTEGIKAELLGIDREKGKEGSKGREDEEKVSLERQQLVIDFKIHFIHNNIYYWTRLLVSKYIFLKQSTRVICNIKQRTEMPPISKY